MPAVPFDCIIAQKRRIVSTFSAVLKWFSLLASYIEQGKNVKFFRDFEYFSEKFQKSFRAKKKPGDLSSG